LYVRFLWASYVFSVRVKILSKSWLFFCMCDFHPSFACLADVIFMIYLYQKWKYPVDKKRVNEFGFGGEDDQVADGAEVAATKEDDKKTN
jgi:hypothetical protein